MNFRGGDPYFDGLLSELSRLYTRSSGRSALWAEPSLNYKWQMAISLMICTCKPDSFPPS